jgi:glyoxylase-like metal-dependent hydrolase (beta-lactamase superfamily II)
LFTGDTVFAKGALSYISESGSIGDYINSIGCLTTMKVKEIYPGHGIISKTPEEDMRKALLNAEKLLEGKSGVEIVCESRPS